ncbi:MAG: hypothetical protein HY275_10330 [Gemmatimonadetes bacterium]|nr:hypothetical protein [Gemmatimonadota bacterium]
MAALVPAFGLVIAAVACSDAPGTGLTSPSRLVRTNATKGAFAAGEVAYTVQGLTTEGGLFWASCSNNSLVYNNTSHWHDTIPGYPRKFHRDSIAMYQLDASCQQSGHAFNGGWINVYDIADGSAKYVGQVQGDLVMSTFRAEGTTGRTVRLDAYPDPMRGCSFTGFDGANPSVTSITITGAGGPLPVAYFEC